MHRVGILNFWYYDEEEFQLEDGRLILRGANGSGKSVTMQSFLPLVLDGDKRAHRLDPFGSRDRRIEYYLLGEEDDGKTDTTGYLWIEFKHGGTGVYRTVGIGLRARRNAAQVQFWGFLLEDGQRIGRDFWLYDRNQWLEDGIRIPLDRKSLESKIGAGGQVVFDQKSYQDMVNKHIFGFADTDAYQDLLQLMIQLRSPKLSKDFKPSAIYEILHQALPPLMEEELRPLSEVLEDMDQMTDRLDELKRHRTEMLKLQERYDFYNKHMLYTRSEHLLETKSTYDEVDARVKSSVDALAQAEAAKADAAKQRSRMQEQLQEIAVERELLEKHEAIGKQREYDAAMTALADTEKQLERSKERAGKTRIKQEQLGNRLQEAGEKQDAAEREQQELLGELEAIAGDMEFVGHAIYHRYWSTDIPIDDIWREAWRKDLRDHRDAVERSLAKAVEEKMAAALVKESEIELGEASRVRDEAERQRGEREKQFEESKEAFKDEIIIWQRELQQMAFAEDEMRVTFGALREYGLEQTSLEPVRKTLLSRYEAAHENLVMNRLGMEKQREDLVDERRRFEEEKRGWEQSREPEPARSEARSKYREGSSQRGGAPFFAACDFQPHVSDEAKARLEEALECSGLLDAWLFPDGQVLGGDSGVEEAWIIPRPLEFGYTLADMLTPAPPEGSGLTAELVDAVLRSFLWDEEGSLLDNGDWNGILSADGSYRLGSLAGKAAVKQQAEYIGKETRRRTRMLAIARLNEAIGALDATLRELGKRIAEQEEAERRLVKEREQFPGGTEMARALQELQSADYRLQSAVHQEGQANERFKAKSAHWRELQRELVELTQGWTRLKQEKDLAAAIGIIRDYEAMLSDLHSAWRQYREAYVSRDRLAGELDTVILELEDEEALTDELDERRRVQRTQVDTLRRLIEELGLADVARRMEELRNEQSALHGQVKEVERLLDEAKDKAARAEAQLVLLREQAETIRSGLEQEQRQLMKELGHGLVGEWKVSVGMTDTEEVQSHAASLHMTAKEIRRQYEPLFAGRNAENIVNRLLEQFNAARMLLTEYVLETVVDETSGRILLLSMRNPHQPLPPHVLLNELEHQEAEQGALLSDKDRELYEEIILRSVGKAVRQRIHRAEQWVREMNKLMEERDTSSGLRLKLEWQPKSALGEHQLDVSELVELLKRDSHRLREDEIDAMIEHFRGQISSAKQAAQEEQESLRQHLYTVLDYRNWFQFELKYKKGAKTGYRPLTDARFNVLSGGEKAMAMYIPLFAATSSRYSDARPEAPRLISLDEAFAGVDEENMRDMFKLLTDMGFDYMMTSQVLWGCYDTVPKLAIYEIYRPKDVDFVTLFRYRWNGKRKEYVESGAEV
ncbi:TIGR02680 family protein [Paenibacillus woosongensis]|uniref:TIGR02680 family protein n=1 Tax=Paenibacillus woosongensis TaxID=307580 RepID=A0AA95I7G9_9BACL|nr:TIGR02680 family protein [Paenibacillus woosongensis]WHX49402.1 TIGR02680 family protein [Paenibacillus woosongensis]